MDRFPYPAAGRAVYMLLKRLADERDVGVLCSAAEGHGTPTDHHAGRHRLPSFLPSFLPSCVFSGRLAAILLRSCMLLGTEGVASYWHIRRCQMKYNTIWHVRAILLVAVLLASSTLSHTSRAQKCFERFDFCMKIKREMKLDVSRFRLALRGGSNNWCRGKIGKHIYWVEEQEIRGAGF